MATILIVDDYAPNHRLLSFVLEQHGHAVVTAADGQQALERLQTATFDLVVTDLTMPRMDGLMLTRAIREDIRFQHLPVIMLTASIIERDQAQASGVGVNIFMTKPVDSEDLIAEVGKLLEQQTLGDSQEPPLLQRSAA